MSFIMKNESFICSFCKKHVELNKEGSARNHCPYCLYSKHLDDKFPGDRQSSCKAIMKPVGIDFKKNKGYMIIHECVKCKKKVLNKTASDDNFLDFIKNNNFIAQQYEKFFKEI